MLEQINQFFNVVEFGMFFFWFGVLWIALSSVSLLALFIHCELTNQVRDGKL